MNLSERNLHQAQPRSSVGVTRVVQKSRHSSTFLTELCLFFATAAAHPFNPAMDEREAVSSSNGTYTFR
jgi:hypothetical protein